MVRSNGKFSWKKLAIGLGISALVIFGGVSLFTEDLVTPVEDQLHALSENRITEAYYRYTAQEFQSGTPLSRFREFVQSFPILNEKNQFTYETSQSNGNIARVLGEISARGGQVIQAQYHLKKEEDKWKILAMKFVQPKKDKPHRFEKQSLALSFPIETQLNTLKQGETFEAYESTSSQEFKKNTSFEEFKAFLERYPIISDHAEASFKSFSQGDKEGHVVVDLSGDGEVYTVNYKLIKEDDQWKIWNIRLTPPIAKKSQSFDQNMTVVKQPIVSLLTSIKQRDLKNAYYDNVTDEFIQVTPYELFEDFVAAFPILTNYASIEIGQLEMEDDQTGVLQVDFYSPKGMTVMEYTLVQKDDQWKILGIKVVQHKEFETGYAEKNKEVDSHLIDTKALVSVINGQIEAIQKGNLQDAYYKFTAKGFREATALDLFEYFMKKHPAYAFYQSGEFGDLTFNSNIGTLKGVFVASTGVRYPVEYDLVLEEGNWKILHIEVHPPSNEIASVNESEQVMRFTDIIMGSKVDLNGIIKEPKNIFSPDTKDLYVNVYVANGKKGTVIQLYFKHVDTDAEIPPVSTTINEDGESVVSFVYTPPSLGWPEGDYELRVIATSGQEMIYKFTVTN